MSKSLAESMKKFSCIAYLEMQLSIVPGRQMLKNQEIFLKHLKKNNFSETELVYVGSYQAFSNEEELKSLLVKISIL